MNYFLIAHRKIFHSQAVTLRYVFIYLFIFVTAGTFWRN